MSTDETTNEPIFEGTNPEQVSDEGSSSPAVDEGGEGAHPPLLAAPPSQEGSGEKAAPAPKKKAAKKKTPPPEKIEGAEQDQVAPVKSTKSKKKKTAEPPETITEATTTEATEEGAEAVSVVEKVAKAPAKKAASKKTKKAAKSEVSSTASSEEEGEGDNLTGPEHFDKEAIEKDEPKLAEEGKKLIEESLSPAKEESGQLSEIREAIQSEMDSLSDEFGLEDVREAIKDIDFFSGNTSDECLERFCENIKTTLGYCRYHYIKNWKAIKKKRMILKEGKLQALIEELVKKYPSKYIEAILNDLTGEKEFYQVLKELNIDTNFQEDDAVDIDLDDDISVETRSYTATRVGYDDDEIL